MNKLKTLWQKRRSYTLYWFVAIVAVLIDIAMLGYAEYLLLEAGIGGWGFLGLLFLFGIYRLAKLMAKDLG